ncbi:UBX domain-containing protein 8 isoform X1 [Astyanax mexicanus]|uniref:UBX domain-containing protein 8 isoform X1 n=1 Tax=Astyanax mexicanus TaxID=7994 RepID=UPI0020CAA27B|nr:UBX domain-containing protein 8 isoform X1 [Astyanax mexicanus]
MAGARDVVLYGVLFASVFCIFSWKFSILGIRAALQLAGRGLLLLAVAAWMASCLLPKLKTYLLPESPLESPVDEENSRQRQEQARRELQQKHVVKSSAYHESVLKPRGEAARRKKEEDFYHMTGQTWKLSQGTALGGEGGTEADAEEGDETPSQRAARRRKQLEKPHLTPVQKERPKEKRIIILPDEPSENAEGVVRIALRVPGGRTVQRRFLRSCSSSVLLDWLHKSGYPPTIYGLYTSFPRRPLITHTDLSMEDAGIVMDTALNVGEMDPDEP